MLNDRTTPLSLLRTRRSGRPRDMIAPGPSDAQLSAMLEIAARTPDHGKLAPWRFVIVPAEARDRLSAVITTAYRAERPQAAATEIAALEAFARQAPALVVVLSQPKPESHIPSWEQELSAGAACMNLLHAAHAMGFVAGWVTGWACYSEAVRDAFAAAPARIAGFVFIGAPGAALEERPRPALDTVVTTWGA
ncbi:MAG: nitroreductase [Proteobacteria bacterium SG_bin5]|nr:nitroreductase [Sphingomonas sp.]OQW41594.1 MAG: nitroreductase [Proteobacteria bacterium SG_bin5]